MKGFTLVEVLIVTIIFMIVSLIISNTVLLSNLVYSQKEKSTEILQNGRVVLDVISREIRQTRKIVTDLSENQEEATNEITFQDGHLPLIIQEGYLAGEEGTILKLNENASSFDDYYINTYIKVYNEENYEIRKIIRYNGSTKEAMIEMPLENFTNYTGLSYLIDTRYYYVQYYLDEDELVKRKVFAYYFSDNSNLYVPFNAIPVEGENIEIEILESPKIIGEYVEEIAFWKPQAVNIFITLKKDNKEISLFSTVFSRNI